MKIIEQAKNILGSAPLIAKLLVGKTYAITDTAVDGKLQIIAKVECSISNISYEISEHFEQAHNNATENKVYSIGKLQTSPQLSVNPLEAQVLDFSVPIKIDQGSSGDISVYSWDMALMNKFADRAKKASSKFILTATISVKDYDKPITESMRIKFK